MSDACSAEQASHDVRPLRAFMSADNWDELLRDLGANPSATGDEAEPPTPPSAPTSPAASTVGTSPPLPAMYPTPKPSAWDSLAVSLGVAGAPAPPAQPPAPAHVSPRDEVAPSAPPFPSPRTLAPEPPRAAPTSQPAQPARGATPAAVDAAMTEGLGSSDTRGGAVADPEPSAKPRGFTGWFPFAARRAKPEPVAPAPEEAELPSDLFSQTGANRGGSILDDAEPADTTLSSDNGGEGDSEARSDEEGRPRRRRRRGGRRRRKKSDDTLETADDAAEAEGDEGEEARDDEARDDEARDDDAGELSSDDERSDDSEAKPRRRRRRRRSRGRSEGDVEGSDATPSDSVLDEEDEDDSAGLTADASGLYSEADDDLPAAISHKNIVSWTEAIGVVIDANIAARSERRRLAGGGRTVSSRGGRSRGGRRRRGSGSNPNGAPDGG